jgi:hypothetical protein
MDGLLLGDEAEYTITGDPSQMGRDPVNPTPGHRSSVTAVIWVM